MGIDAAMIMFSKGMTGIMKYIGMEDAFSIINGTFSLDKLLVVFTISVAINTIFAPIFMTFHKITDRHILNCGDRSVTF